MKFYKIQIFFKCVKFVKQFRKNRPWLKLTIENKKIIVVSLNIDYIELPVTFYRAHAITSKLNEN